MLQGDALGRIGVWGHLDSLSAGELRPYVARVAELGYGALWVPDVLGREPFALLAWVADAAGERMWLGTSIANIYARDAVTMRMSALTLHELTGGRFALGLGVSHRHLVSRVRGHEYERPVATMREYLAAYRAAPWQGPPLEGLPRPEPLVLVAALRARMLTLAATDADGAWPYLATPERVRWMRGVMDAASGPSERKFMAVTLPVVPETDPDRARAAARPYVGRYLRAPNYQASWTEQGFDESDWAQPGSDRLVDAMVAWGSPTEIDARVREMLDAGADHVALIPLAPDGRSEENVATLEILTPVTRAVR